MSGYESLLKVVDILAAVDHSPNEIAERAAPKIAEALEEQYALGQDPYGAPWASLQPSTLKKHGPPPLTDSGDMKSGTDAVSAGPQIIATAPEPADYHQGGTRSMPARPILPNENQGLPSSWEKALKEAASEVEATMQRRINAA